MNDDFLNIIYDILAQNEVSSIERAIVTRWIDHVDIDRKTIIFINDKGKEFELCLK